MKEKLQLFKDAEQLTQSRLAEILETQPGNISHILSGRSKPGFELLQKLLQRFPRLNPDWLLLDKGPMYRDTPMGDASTNDPAAQPQHTLFAPTAPVEESSPTSAPTENLASAPLASIPTDRLGEVARVVVLYTDGTFESFGPKR